MRKLLNKLTKGMIFSLSMMYGSVAFALTQNSMPTGQTTSMAGVSGNATGGITTALTYLSYGLWAASALGLIAIGFMLFNNVQDTILKNVAKGVGVICILALAFSVPGWFGMNMIELMI